MILLVGSIGVLRPAYAQDNKELARQLVEIGDEILRSTFAFEQAREQYLAAIEADPENIRANYMAGEMYLHSVTKDRAKQYFIATYILNTEYTFDLLYKIGLSHQYGREFDHAIDYYNQYLQRMEAQPHYTGDDMISQAVVERKIYECEIGMQLMAAPRKVSIVNLGSNVNSESDDYAPVLNADETVLIYTSRRLEGNLSQDVHDDNLPFEDIFITSKNSDEWAGSSNIGPTINTEGHDSNLALSKDGSQLFIYNSDVNGGDIFVSTSLGSNSWSEAVRLHEPVNSEYNENGVSLSIDGNWLFFSSDRPGGQGGHDIYVSERHGARGWGHPSNLGTVINTQYDEEGPFIGYDGKTLYFSSRGGRGMGGYDIFKSEYDSTTGTWGVPQNLGHPINTPDDDVHFSPTEDGFRAYYATTRDDGFGYTDIYEITFIDDREKILQLPPEPKPLKPAVVTFHIVDADTEEPLNSSISLVDATTQEILNGHGTSGIFTFEIESRDQKEYNVSAELQGFAFYNDRITLPGASEEGSHLERIIKLKRLETGYSRVLRNLYFDFDKATLKETSMPELNKLEKMLSENPGMRIGVIGHTDNVGTESYNTKLSEKRAKAVKDFLVDKGIDTRRIKTAGLGARFPLASNDDEDEGRELNRRVEMVVIE